MCKKTAIWLKFWKLFELLVNFFWPYISPNKSNGSSFFEIFKFLCHQKLCHLLSLKIESHIFENLSFLHNFFLWENSNISSFKNFCLLLWFFWVSCSLLIYCSVWLGWFLSLFTFSADIKLPHSSTSTFIHERASIHQGRSWFTRIKKTSFKIMLQVLATFMHWNHPNITGNSLKCHQKMTFMFPNLMLAQTLWPS